MSFLIEDAKSYANQIKEEARKRQEQQDLANKNIVENHIRQQNKLKEVFTILDKNKDLLTEQDPDPSYFQWASNGLISDNNKGKVFTTDREAWYKTRDWEDIPNQYRMFYVDKWKKSHPTSPQTLYRLLHKNESGTEYYHINCFMSQNQSLGKYDYGLLPNPDDPIYKVEKEKLDYFYTFWVPYIGAWYEWWKQIDTQYLSLASKAKYEYAFNMMTASAWFERLKEDLPPLLPTLGIGSVLAVVGIIGVAVITNNIKK